MIVRNGDVSGGEIKSAWDVCLSVRWFFFPLSLLLPKGNSALVNATLVHLELPGKAQIRFTGRNTGSSRLHDHKDRNLWIKDPPAPEEGGGKISQTHNRGRTKFRPQVDLQAKRPTRWKSKTDEFIGHVAVMLRCVRCNAAFLLP